MGEIDLSHLFYLIKYIQNIIISLCNQNEKVLMGYSDTGSSRAELTLNQAYGKCLATPTPVATILDRAALELTSEVRMLVLGV